MEKLLNCNIFRDSIVHFQAGELNADEHDAMLEHLSDCAGCARRLEVEDGMLRAVRAKLTREVAPPGLETRIRAALDAQAPPARGRGWYRGSWVAAAAASVLLALLLVAGLGPGASLLGGGTASMQVVSQEVVVVDGPCDQGGVPIDQQRQCRHPQHLNVLRVSESHYWNVSLDSEVGRQLLLDPSWRGRRMTVDGTLYPDIRTLQLERYEVLNAVSAGLCLWSLPGVMLAGLGAAPH